MAVSDYSTTPGNNTAISGIFIGEGCPPANINDAIRQMMADLADLYQKLTDGSAGFTYVPVGGVVAFTGTNAPGGFLLCFGQAISRTSYPALFAAIGTRYGVGNGSTTFNVPDLRDRVVVGTGNMGGSDAGRIGTYATTLGASGGAGEVTLTTDTMPVHSHTGSTGSAGSHNHRVGVQGFGPASTNSENTIFYFGGNDRETTTNGVHTHSFTTNTTGGGSAHNNVQPFTALNYIVRAV